MAQNKGKIFEEDFKKSVPFEYFFYRFKDGTGNFNGQKNDNVRFQAKNMCDCEVMAEDHLFLLELKSHLGNSVGFNCIRKNQIEEMSKVDHKKIRAYFIFNFRDKEKTYAVDAKQLKNFMETTERKSIPISWCEENGIEIIGQKKKVRYKYLLDRFFEDAAKETCRNNKACNSVDKQYCK